MQAKTRQVLLTTLLTLTVACGQKKGDSVTGEASKTDVQSVPVHVATIESATFIDRIQLYGRVDARNAVRVTAEIMGQIESLPVEEGQRVARGQTLVRVNARVVEAQKKQAEASHQLAVAERDRTKKLVEKNLSTPQQLDVAEAQVAQAAAALELAAAQLDKAVIRSPISGVVTNLTAKQGEITGGGFPLMEVVDAKDVEVRAEVSEQDISLIKEGVEVDIKVDAYPERLFRATVGHIGLSANRTTRTFPIRLRVDNRDLALRPGMLATLDLERQRIENAIVVPRDAVLDDVNSKRIFVVEGGQARERIVELGPTRGRFAITRTGISEGETLIVLGHRQVVDGQSVSVVERSTCCKSELTPHTKVGELNTPPAKNAGSTKADL
jgi:membrane fusion protein (multidrug efflux system)